MRFAKLLLAAVAVSALSSAAWAQFGGGGGGGFGGGFGGGGGAPGQPSQPRDDETPEQIAAKFDRADANRDGVFSVQEYKTTLSSALQSVGDVLYLARDRNRDGKVTRSEYINFGTSVFDDDGSTTVAVNAGPARTRRPAAKAPLRLRRAEGPVAEPAAQRAGLAAQAFQAARRPPALPVARPPPASRLAGSRLLANKRASLCTIMVAGARPRAGYFHGALTSAWRRNAHGSAAGLRAGGVAQKQASAGL